MDTINNKILEIKSLLNRNTLKENKTQSIGVEHLKKDEQLSYLDNYLKGVFSIDGIYYKNLALEKQQLFLNYFENLKKEMHLN